MDDFFKVKHSFNAGDLIILLPGFRKLYQDTGKKTRLYQRLNLGAFYYDNCVHPITNEGVPVCQNEDIFNRLKPLIEAQDYIESFQIWEGQKVDYDIDLTRDSKWIPMPSGMIHQWAWSLYPELNCDLSEKWLDVGEASDIYFHKKGDEKTGYSGNASTYIIVNRTERYTNPYITFFFLKDYTGNIVFSGTEQEHKIFCEQWKLDLPLLESNNFLTLSKFIAACKLFIGNQSLHWHLADAMKCKRILELCPQFPNSFPTGANGHSFYHQKSLEYYFSKLTNE